MDGWLISRYEFSHLTGPNKLCSTVEEKVADQTVNTIECGTLKCVDSNALSYQNIDAKLPEAVSEEATLMRSNYDSQQTYCFEPKDEVELVELAKNKWLQSGDL
ncbi:Uncharacterized protein Fot_07047 [Forsythia ovata]|uniref:Uncharacterized protein n=1 Tax=Forsythia ovata TaxID=205694 RepID=A0ABD1WXL9_9LAMI